MDLLWSVESKPTDATVTFDPDRTVEGPLITADKYGAYIFRLTADDGEFARYDEMSLTFTEADCRAVRDLNLLYEADLTGPEGVPDCIINILDFAELAGYWLLP